MVNPDNLSPTDILSLLGFSRTGDRYFDGELFRLLIETQDAAGALSSTANPGVNELIEYRLFCAVSELVSSSDDRRIRAALNGNPEYVTWLLEYNDKLARWNDLDPKDTGLYFSLKRHGFVD
ncbi:hypothetical protein JW887_05250 [Candidatus Dojkabacteria bacterium]|nr:hypothetical protein [Candidatus Dojkabacteria bacterium]